ncbi:MAG: hypothetical protein IPO48_15780 [Saprospiraceae bacterium]|nr:hypothetical protein [Saprospiraceae bacterium]
MQNKAFITVVFIFILSISGWAQKKKPTQKSDIKILSIFRSIFKGGKLDDPNDLG